MFTKKFFFNSYLILIICFLEVKSKDNSDGICKRPVIIKGDLTHEDENAVNTAVQENNLIDRLEKEVALNTEDIEELKNYYPEANITKEEKVEKELRQNLNDTYICFKIRPLEPKHEAPYRRRYIQQLQALRNHLELERQIFIPFEREAQLNYVKETLEFLDNFRKEEDLDRQNDAAVDKCTKEKRKKQYKAIDDLEKEMRENLKLLRQRHEQKQPFNSQHYKLVNTIDTLVDKFDYLIDDIDNQRMQDKIKAKREQFQRELSENNF